MFYAFCRGVCVLLTASVDRPLNSFIIYPNTWAILASLTIKSLTLFAAFTLKIDSRWRSLTTKILLFSWLSTFGISRTMTASTSVPFGRTYLSKGQRVSRMITQDYVRKRSAVSKRSVSDVEMCPYSTVNDFETSQYVFWGRLRVAEKTQQNPQKRKRNIHEHQSYYNY